MPNLVKVENEDNDNKEPVTIIDDKDVFVGFLNSNVYNQQINEGSGVKIFTNDGSYKSATALRPAKRVNNQDICLIVIGNNAMQVDVQSIYV